MKREIKIGVHIGYDLSLGATRVKISLFPESLYKFGFLLDTTHT